ncbi:peptidyl-prolyl cis-trans isomerase fkbp4 [Plakobranchus ocellatus]|uniref:Peptidyl-prolyl cis-trans isomerase fkbp4 n=1 Tax=Plakobranchus ocellatus TaxID=259542 RepID=A0AAV3Y2D7_9GAST|nr:peptidyl-prolyl cis-trans isomerase fkbp4 [Plakobranchus ocellatus]
MGSNGDINEGGHVCKEGQQEQTIIQSKFHGKITKTVLKHGKGFSQPCLESCCEVNILFDENSLNLLRETDSNTDLQSIESGQTFEITIGRSSGSVIMRTIETCLMSMRDGEVSKFTFDFPHNSSASKGSYGEECRNNKTHISVSTTLSLHSFSQAPPTWKLSSSEKYTLSVSHKAQGNEHFQRSDTEMAFYCYSTAVKYLICIPELSVVSETGPLCLDDSASVSLEEFKKLLCICYLNLAACQAKVSNHEGVIENCSRALTVDAGSVKGLYRRAVAYIASGRKDLARTDLLKAQKLESQNKTIASLLKSCQ